MVDISAIYEQYSTAIYRYARKLCHDEVVAADITSETFTRLMEMTAIGKGPQTNMRSYLYQTAYHLVIDHYRIERHQAPLEAALDVVGESVEERCEESTLLQLVASAAKQLTIRQQFLFVSYYEEGHTRKEIAAVKGTTRTVINSLHIKVIRKIRRLLCVHVWEERQMS